MQKDCLEQSLPCSRALSRHLYIHVHCFQDTFKRRLKVRCRMSGQGNLEKGFPNHHEPLLFIFETLASGKVFFLFTRFAWECIRIFANTPTLLTRI